MLHEHVPVALVIWSNILRLTTGKNEKEYSWHVTMVTAMKFIEMKQLV